MFRESDSTKPQWENANELFSHTGVGAVLFHPGSLQTDTTHLGVGVGTHLVSLTPGSSEVTELSKENGCGGEEARVC